MREVRQALIRWVRQRQDESIRTSEDGVELELFQRILGHESADMTLGYVDPHLPRIEDEFRNTWKNVI